MKQPAAKLVLVLSVLALGTVGCGPTASDDPASSSTAEPNRSSPVTGTPEDAPSNATARGETHGLPFELERAEIQNDILTLHGEEGRTFFVFLFLDEGEQAAGNRFEFSPAEMGAPHIHMHYRSADGIEIDTFMEDYSMKLEFGQPENGSLPGNIQLRLPDEPGSFITGRFEASLPG